MSPIKAKPLSGTAKASGETGERIGRANWRLRICHHGDGAVFRAAAHRSKPVVESFLREDRLDHRLSGRHAGQIGWA